VGPQPIDPEAYRERLDRISELFAAMIDHATELSKERCPYRDRLDRCTAAFGCRNQRWPEGKEGPKICGGDHKLDYRSAWESG
jgi:hypothetical protein